MEKENMRQEGKKQPLAGVRVVALEQYIAGPYCSMLLADAGAEVIKVERPPFGDPRRQIGPMTATPQGKDVSGGFWGYNRSKKSITLNLQDEQGREIFKQLAAAADVVLVNLRPGAMEKLGLGFTALKEVNPRLVYASITGFGEMPGYKGPYWERPAFDIVAEAMSGVMEMVGFADRPPHFTLFGMADLVTAIFTSYGIMLALYQREQTGEGQFVESPMYDSMLALNERAVMQYSLTGQAPSRGRESLQGPRGAFKAKDGYIAFNTPTDIIWQRFTGIIGREDLNEEPRSKTAPARAANMESFLRPIIEEWLQDKTREEAVEVLMQAGVPAGPVYNMEDIFNCPHVKKREMLVDVPAENESFARPFARSPVMLSASAGELPVKPPPPLGKHTEEILLDLGFDRKQVEHWREKGVI